MAALASTLYTRLLDWVEDYINSHLKLTQAVYGFTSHIVLLDLPGIADRPGRISDDFGTLLANTTNEMLHHIVQKVLVQVEEGEASQDRLKLRYPSVQGNKGTLDGLLSLGGLVPVMNESSMNKTVFDPELNRKVFEDKFCSSPDCHLVNGVVKVNHFWVQVLYALEGMFERNENFINPEIIQTLGSSSDECLRSLFQFPLNGLGKVHFDELGGDGVSYSQTLAQQTILSRYKHWLNMLIQTIFSTTTSYVFSFTSSATGGPTLTEQVEALNIKEFTYVRKKGFPFRLSFADFLRRFCFLAFEFDERVIASKEHAQLLMLRLSIDGFECGKRKIFLKYYHIRDGHLWVEVIVKSVKKHASF